MAGFEGVSRRGRMGNQAWTLAAAACAFVATSEALGQRYEMLILETPPEYRSIGFVFGINNRGHVVGMGIEEGTTDWLPALWRDGRFVQLPLLPSGGNRFAWADGINDAGQVVGLSDGPIYGQYAVFWPDDQTIVNLLNRDSAGDEINDRGVIIGNYAVATFSYKPFIWENGVWSPLWPALDWANDINNLNQVVGDDGQFAVVWENGEVTYLPGLRPGAPSGATGINDLGDIVGGSQNDDELGRPVVWRDGGVRELPRLLTDRRGSAWSINMKGDIVGPCFITSHDTHPVLWRNNLGMDLNDLTSEAHPEWIFKNTAVWINDAGQIALAALHVPTSTGHGIVLNPVDTGLTVWGIAPARPGRRNTIQVNHATPGGRVSLLWGTARTEPQPLQQCQGAMIDIADPRLAASGVAGPDGRALIRLNIPTQTEGTFILQVVDHRSCEVSPPAWTLIKAEN